MYGLMIVTGIAAANLFAVRLLRSASWINADKFILLEAYGFLGGAVGAKLLYLMVSFDSIDWPRLGDIVYLSSLMSSGFVFYGGLIGALLALFAGCHFEKISLKKYLGTFIFMIPMMHGFGRIGCFCAGCCYGIPYSGAFSVVFPEGSFAPSGIQLFPVQLLEAVLLIILSLCLYAAALRSKCRYSFAAYLIVYAVLRFFLEYLRYDEARGYLWIFSTSQWISLFLTAAGVIVFIRAYHAGDQIIN